MQRAQVTVHTDLAEDLPQVTGDRVQLQQVIVNLFLNAADAMSSIEDRPRRLVIKTGREGGDHVRLSVEDTGVGFEPGRAESLFDAFYTTKQGSRITPDQESESQALRSLYAITVKAHRGQAMRKMNAASFADLLNMAARLGLASASKRSHNK